MVKRPITFSARKICFRFICFIHQAKNIRSVLVNHNNDYTEILQKMQTIFKTKKDIAERLSETPVYIEDKQLITDSKCYPSKAKYW